MADIRTRKYLLDKFDPFEDRMSRDIRNTLSDAFVKSLARFESSMFEYNRRQAAEKLAFKANELVKQYSHELGFIANLQDLVDRLGDIDLNPPILETAIDPGTA